MRASFSAESVERGVAELGVQVIRRELAQQRVGRQVHERRAAVDRAEKCRHVERQQAAAFDVDAAAGLPLAEHRVEPVDLAGGDPGKQRFGDLVRELGEAERMRRHGVAWSAMPRTVVGSTWLCTSRISGSGRSHSTIRAVLIGGSTTPSKLTSTTAPRTDVTMPVGAGGSAVTSDVSIRT